MVAEIPTDYAFFVQRLVAERRFLTETDVVTAALRLLQAREELRQEVRLGFHQLDAGLGGIVRRGLCAGGRTNPGN